MSGLRKDLEQKKWTPEEIEKLKELLLKGTRNREIAKQLGRTYLSVKAKTLKLRRTSALTIPKRIGGSNSYEVIFNQQIPIWNDSLVFKTKDAMITCDWHLPYLNKEMFMRLLQKAKQLNIKKLFIIGDFVSLEVFSFWKNSAGKAPKFAVELEVSTQVIGKLFEWFTDIVILIGNHEIRYWNLLDGRDDFNTLFNWLCGKMFDEKNQKVTISYHGHCEIDTGGKYNYRLTHQKNYSRVCLSIPRRLANKYSDQHLICSHTHNLGVGFADDGNRIIAEAGNMSSTKYFEYICRVDSTHGAWVPGFLILKDGKLSIQSEMLGI